MMGTTSGVKKNSFSDVAIAVVLSLLAWPFTYFLDTGITKVHDNNRSLVMMSISVVLLITILFVAKNLNKQKNWIRYVFTVFSFTSMISIIIVFESKGWIKGFMSQYIHLCEPYLLQSWGCAISLFDGIFMYTMYLVIIHRIANGKQWRSMCIYLVSGLFNSMIVILFGAASGKHTPTFCIFLNVPYVLVPVFIGIRLFTKEKAQDWSINQINSNGFLFDLTMAIGLVCSILLVFAKGMLSIGSQFKIFQDILSHERALLDMDPAPFAIIQSLVFLFYSLPILIISLAYIFRKRKPQLVWDLALINAGLLLQAQFTFIVTALDSKTPADLRSDLMDWKFWMNNLTLLIVPQIFVWGLYKSNVGNVVGSKEGRKRN